MVNKTITAEEAAIRLVKGETLEGYIVDGFVTITEELWQEHNPSVLPTNRIIRIHTTLTALHVRAEVDQLFVLAKVKFLYVRAEVKFLYVQAEVKWLHVQAEVGYLHVEAEVGHLHVEAKIIYYESSCVIFNQQMLCVRAGGEITHETAKLMLPPSAADIAAALFERQQA